MGLAQAAVLVATGSGVLYTTVPAAVAPKFGDPDYQRVIWLIAVISGSLLVGRGLIAIGDALVRRSASLVGWAMTHTPYDIRAPFVRRTPTNRKQVAELGILDFQLALETAISRVTVGLSRMSGRMDEATVVLTRYAPLLASSRALPTRAKIKLARQYASTMLGRVRRLQRSEDEVRQQVLDLTKNYLAKLRALPGDADLVASRLELESIRDSATVSRGPMAQYMESVQLARRANLQQSMNEVHDKLLVAAGRMLEDYDRLVQFADDALNEIASRTGSPKPQV